MKTTRRTFLTAAACAPIVAKMAAALRAQAGDRLVYVGTYTNNANSPSKGIYAWRFQASSGTLSPIGAVAETDNPSFLAVRPGGKFLYAVNELSKPGDDPMGGVSAYAINGSTGALTFINKVKSRGLAPAHLTVDSAGKWVIIGNYGNAQGTEGTSVATFRIRPDGGLDEQPAAFIPHPAPSHPHCVLLSPDNKFLVVAEKGQNRVVVYRFDANSGALTPNDPPFADAAKPGSGPRHLAFGKGAKFLYVCHEQARSVSTYAFDPARGVLTFVEMLSTLPEGAPATGSTAEISVHPDGTFLYVSNRGNDSLARFAIDPVKGTLTLRGHTPTGGRSPRNFQIDPTGDYLFAENQQSSLTVVMKIDRKTGDLTPTGATLDAPAPVCIVFV